MSNEYRSRSSRRERRSSRWANKDSDVVEAAANQAIRHLEEEPEGQNVERTSRQKLTHEKTLRIPLAVYGLLTGLSVLLALSFMHFLCGNQ